MKPYTQKIRFKKTDGSNYPDWEEKKLKELLGYKQPTKYIVKSTDYNNAYKIPVLTAGKSFILGYTNETADVYDDLPVIIFDDFTTTSQFVDFPFKIKSSAMKMLKAKKDMNIKFVYEAMGQIKYEIGGHSRHWISKYSNINIPVPTPQEQQKIAEFLTAVDEKIENLQKKKEQFEKYKKGMMQKIFSQKIRFRKSNGSNYPDWEEMKLGEICEYRNGGSFESEVVENGEYNLITLNSIDINGRIKNNHKTVDRASWFLRKDDLIMVLSDVAHGNFLGLVDIITENNKYVLNQRMGLLRKKDDNVDLKFLRTYINKNQKYFKLHGQGSSQQNLAKGDILKFKIPAPCLSEQQKIAEFLTSLDNKVDLINQKIEQAKLFKKALLQKMFA